MVFILILPFVIWIWIKYELKKENIYVWKRITLGIIVFLLTGILAWDLAYISTALEYKVWDGAAIKKLINTVINKIEDKHTDVLVKELKDINLIHKTKYSEQIDLFCKKLEKKSKLKRRRSQGVSWAIRRPFAAIRVSHSNKIR